MKIECIKNKIQEIAGKLDRIANKNASLPVLGCLLFIAKNNTLTLKATNLDVGVEIVIPVKVLKEGVVAVPANILSSVLSNLKANKLVLEEEENNLLKISGESSVVQLKTVPPEEFPLIPRVENGENYKLPIKELIFGIKSVVFSASVSSIKPELGSVFINHKDGQLIFAATDSFRLAEKKIQLKLDQSIKHILLPLKNTQELIKIFEGTDEKADVSVSKNQMSVSTGDIYFTSRVVDGVFPDYEQIIPKEFLTTATLLKQDVLDALKTTNSVVDKYNQVVFDVITKKQQMIVKTKNNDVGEGEVVLKTKPTGDDISISFNQKYITDAGAPIADDSVTFKFGGPHKPLLIEGASNKSFRYIVMPMNR